MSLDDEISSRRPYAEGRRVDPKLLRLAMEEGAESVGRRVDDASGGGGGRNNFWEATCEVGGVGGQRQKSNLKWKWQSKIDERGWKDLVVAVTGPDGLTADEEAAEELRSVMRRKVDEDDDDDAVTEPDLETGPADTSIEEVLPPAEKRPRMAFGIFPTSPKAATTAAAPFREQVIPSRPLAATTHKFGLPGLVDRKPAPGGGLPQVQLSNNVQQVDANPPPHFRTAAEQLAANFRQSSKVSSTSYGTSHKTLGASRPSLLQAAFKPPIMAAAEPTSNNPPPSAVSSSEEVVDQRLKNLEPKMVDLIRDEIMECGTAVGWDDIAGLEFVKSAIKEIVVFPMLRPDIFKGLKAPPKGILLFGPPGTGKTMIGRCIASQSRSTFFSISASSLTSKWVGEGEKMVRTLFAVARVHQPSVIFIDEIDSLLSARSDNENESSRRIKTEFLVQLDGATTQGEERILIVGATNRPQDLDEAARRRLVKRLYVPLPESEAQKEIIKNLLKQEEKNSLSEEDIALIVSRTAGYSGADMSSLCRDAAMGPIRDIDYSLIETIPKEDIRGINVGDFINSLRQVKASVSDQDLDLYLDWDRRYGSSK